MDLDLFYNSFLDSFVQVFGLGVGYYVLYLAFSILFMLAIGFDCKSRGNKKQALWMVLSFFFPLIVGIIYACIRNNTGKAQKKTCINCGAPCEDTAAFCSNCGGAMFTEPIDTYNIDERLKKNSKALFGVSVVCYVLAIVIYGIMVANIMGIVMDNADDFDFSDYDNIHYSYTVEGEEVYYDRLGNVYSEDEAVLYYDKDGKTYKLDLDEYVYIADDDTEYDFAYCYVDKDGYLVYDEQGANDYGNNGINIYDITDKYVDVFQDSEGNIYFFANDVSWDKDGNMVDCYGDKIVYKAK